MSLTACASLRNRHQALPSWELKTRRNNRPSGLAVTNGRSSDWANSPHPSSREAHHSTAIGGVELPRSDVILQGFHAAHGLSLAHRTVPSTQMRCRITAKRRARATIAFFMPRRLAICIAQASSHHHLLVRVSMTWAAS